MAVPTWLAAIGHVAGDILGGIVGAQIADLRHEAARRTGEVIQKQAEKASVPSQVREGVMKDLMRLGKDGAALRKLLIEANRGGYVTDSAGKRYLEARLVDLLGKVTERDRGWVYRELDRLYVRDRDEFFALLNIINDDGWLQLIKLARDVATERGASFGRLLQQVVVAIDSTAGAVAGGIAPLAAGIEPTVNESLEALHDRVRAWARR